MFLWNAKVFLAVRLFILGLPSGSYALQPSHFLGAEFFFCRVDFADFRIRLRVTKAMAGRTRLLVRMFPVGKSAIPHKRRRGDGGGFSEVFGHAGIVLDGVEKRRFNAPTGGARGSLFRVKHRSAELR